MKRSIALGMLGLFATLSTQACSADDVGGDSQDIAIDKSTEDPARILPSDFDGTLQKLISPADVGKSFGLSDDRVPYPDTYWPFLVVDDSGKKTSTNGIDDHWQGPSEASPLEKFMAVLDPSRAAEAKAWEKANHGEDVPGVENWFGHCPGWTAAAMVNKPLTKGISIKRDANGNVSTCSGGEGCVKFEIGDINALEAEVYLDNSGVFLGARCDTKPAAVPRDKQGRILKAGCRGLNPGALLIILANRMKNVKNSPSFQPKALAIDAQNEFNTDQIWNQPAYRYEVNAAKPLTEQEAITLTHAKGGALPTKYPFNKDAKGWFKVDIGIKWVQENGPNRQPVSGLRSTKTMRFAAVIELDSDPNSASSRIIGGEFLDDPQTGANRLTVPPFVWTADGLSPDSQNGNHNPFVAGSKVQQIIDLALR